MIESAAQPRPGAGRPADIRPGLAGPVTCHSDTVVLISLPGGG